MDRTGKLKFAARDLRIPAAGRNGTAARLAPSLLPPRSGSEHVVPWRAGMVLVDIADVAKPKFVGRLAFSPPYLPFIGVHTIQPIPGKNLAVVNSEAIRENCNEAANHVSMVDIADLTRPRLIANFPTPLPPAGSPYKSFCEKGDRFGPHNQNQLQHNPFVKKQDHLIYMTYFNAGLRIYDISAPTAPREVGYFMPPDPKERRGVLPKGLAVSSEDVLASTCCELYRRACRACGLLYRGSTTRPWNSTAPVASSTR